MSNSRVLEQIAGVLFNWKQQSILPLSRITLRSTRLHHFKVSNTKSHTLLVPIHSHPLRLPTQLPVRSWTYGPTAANRGVLLERQELLLPKSLIMDLRGRLNEILQMSPRQEIPQRHELAMVLILHIDDAPPVLATTDRLAADDNVLFGTDDGEGNQIFHLGVEGVLFFVVFVVVVGEHAEIVEGEFLLDALFEGLALFEGQGVGFGDHRHDVDHVGEFFEHDDVDGFETTGSESATG